MRLNTVTGVRLIAGSVAQQGKEDQFRALLQGIVVHRRAEQGRSRCQSD